MEIEGFVSDAAPHLAKWRYPSEPDVVVRMRRALRSIPEFPLGGTAVGTGINCHEEFGAIVAAELTKQTGAHFREAQHHFEAQHAKDVYVKTSGHLQTIAVSLSKLANGIR